MEYSLSELKKKSVINIMDGKKLGKITDVKISFPFAKILSFTVSSPCGFFQEPTIITPCEIQRVGEDAILIKPCVNEVVNKEFTEG